jgi:hypothetical protein
VSDLPARLNIQKTAQLLGFAEHDIQAIVAAGLLTPLGRPSPNSVKYFAAIELVRLSRDLKWLNRATDAVQTRWRRKNKTQPPSPRSAPRPDQTQ